ncbi:MAG: NIPSNAP family protein [Bacteroidales bacterium]|jgi:hypothetical protein|nr:NIPSNAP family protein [Bacteroidales bacterium]
MKGITRLSGVLLAVSIIFNGCTFSGKSNGVQEKEIYEWRIYTLAGEAAKLDDFFKETLIPAYNRQGVSAGAFASYREEEVTLRYLLLVYPDLAAYHRVKKAVREDGIFGKAAQPFYDSTAVRPLYIDFEGFLCEAFDKIPRMRQPDRDRTLFEWRLYHSPNEEANQRKIKMFNADEIDLFDKVGINSVCYGEILAGPDMPALIYLTWYKDEPTRNEAWKQFVGHADWQRMKNLPEYAHTATRNTSRLLKPLPYSQF